MFDKWLVICPGRTGSKVICDYIRTYYNHQIKYHDPMTEISNINENFWILHSHNVEHYKQLTSGSVNLIVSTRDLVDSALSWCVVNRSKVWHEYPPEVLNQYPNEKFMAAKVEPFVLSIQELDFHYNNALQFYEELRKCLTKNTTIIDYSQFENDNEKLADILKMDVKQPLLPVKNPENWSWIRNRSEIESKIKNYTRNVSM